ncbi:MAG: hypothetical protein WCJ58_02925 [bacterium]
MEKAELLRYKVQEEIVKVITSRLQEGLIDEKRAKAIAQLVLEKLPEGISYEKLITIIPTLDDHFFELSSVVVPIMVEYEKKMKHLVNQKITALLKGGMLDKAMEMTSKAIEFEKGLS